MFYQRHVLTRSLPKKLQVAKKRMFSFCFINRIIVTSFIHALVFIDPSWYEIMQMVIQSNPVNSYPDNSDLRLIRMHLRPPFRANQSNIIRLIRISHHSYYFIRSIAIRFRRIQLYIERKPSIVEAVLLFACFIFPFSLLFYHFFQWVCFLRPLRTLAPSVCIELAILLEQVSNQASCASADQSVARVMLEKTELAPILEDQVLEIEPTPVAAAATPDDAPAPSSVV